MDAQRVDLWQVDLHGVVNEIRNQLQQVAQYRNSGPLLRSLPSSAYALYYVQSVDLPELVMDSPTIARDALPYLVPGIDHAPSTVKLTFLVDAGSPAPALGSKLLSLLFAWRALGRAGRGSFQGGFADNPDFEFAVGLNDIDGSTLQPTYQFDVLVNLLMGASLQSILSGDQATTGGRGVIAPNPPFEVASAIKIHQMWPIGISPSALQYSGQGVWMITATFGCSGWLPVQVSTAALI
jgi:hypothetical protein